MTWKLTIQKPSFDGIVFFFAMLLNTLIGVLYMIHVRDTSVSLISTMLAVARYLMIIFVGVALLLYFVNYAGQRLMRMDPMVISVLAMAIYSIIVTFLFRGLSFRALVDIALWPLCMVLGVVLGNRKGFMPDGAVIFACTVLFILFSIPNIQLNSASLELSGNHLNYGGTIGAVYFVLYMFPWVVAQKKSQMRSCLLILMVIVIIFTQKRAGVIAVAISFIAYLFVDAFLSQKGRLGRLIRVTILCIVGASIAWLLIQKFAPDILARFYTIFIDEGSGRTDIWETVWYSFKTAPLKNRLLGHGYHAVTDLMLQGRRILAHNDYLEILYDYGVVGCALLVWMIISFGHTLHFLIKTKKQEARIFTFALMLAFVMTMVSVLISESGRFNALALFLGFSAARSGVLDTPRKRSSGKVKGGA